MQAAVGGSGFVRRLCDEALHSAAVSHPYLQRMQTGRLPDMPLALADFAYQYGLYSARFTDCLTALLGRLQNAAHRAIVRHNLDEEHGGHIDAELPADVAQRIAGHSHAELFRQFQQAAGGRDTGLGTDQPGAAWARDFVALCGSGECAGTGAIGIGTELIISRVYSRILDGLRAHTQLTAFDRVFFELHSQCDDEHAEQLLRITTELATDAEARAEIARGVRRSLELRTRFWDAMLARAASAQLAAGAGAR